MIQPSRSFLILLFLVIFLSIGCTSVLYSIVGLKPMRPLEDQEIVVAAIQYGIPKFYSYQYRFNGQYLIAEASKPNDHNSPVKSLSQPLQLRFFAQSDTMLFNYKNCDVAGGVIPDWNHFGLFASIPPDTLHFPEKGKFYRKSDNPVHFQELYQDTVLLFSQEMANLVPLSGAPPPSQINLSDADLTIVVVWTVWMKRYTKRLFKQLHQYQEMHPDKRIQLIYVNMEHLFVE